jgi:hypothetical protein
MATKPKPPTLLDVFERNKYNLADAATRSRTWFDQQVLLLSKQRITPNAVLRSNPSQNTMRIMPGHLYMYSYDPKGKQTLPYYDMFPMVFPYRRTADGFIGLNLHYLPYALRIKLLDRLMIFASNKKMDESTRLKYSWSIIDGVSRFDMAKPCIKQYLNSHVRSAYRKVDSEHWATAMLLPVERFVGTSKQSVWKDSNKTIAK